MLAYLLALVVGLGSFALYMAAFFFPEVHRKNDFIWSGIGMFYALVLWVCAERIRGGLLLGQTASVALLGWLGWQMLMMRRQVTPLEERTALPSSDELKGMLSNLAKPEAFSALAGQVVHQFEKLRNQIQDLTANVGKPRVRVKPELDEPYVPLTPEDFASARRRPEVKPPVDMDFDTEETIAHVEDAIADAIEQTQSSEMPLRETFETFTEEVAKTQAQSPEITPIEAFETFTKEATDQIQEASEQISIATSEVAGDVRETAHTAVESTTKSAPLLKEKATSVFAIFSDIARGLFKKKESKPIYVRKQFRQSTEKEVPGQKASTEGLGEITAIRAELVSEETIVEGIDQGTITEAIATEVMEEMTEKETFPSVEELFEAETLPDQTSEIDSTDTLIEELFQEEEPVSAELSLVDQVGDLGSADAAIAGFEEVSVTEELPPADQVDDLGSADAAIAELFQEEPVTEETSIVEETFQFEPEATVGVNPEETPEVAITEDLYADLDASVEAQDSYADLDASVEAQAAAIPGMDTSLLEAETSSSTGMDELFQEQSEITSETGFNRSFVLEEVPVTSLETSEVIEEDASDEDELLEELAEADLDSDLDMPFNDGETATPEMNSLFQEPLEEPLEISSDVNLETSLANLEEGSVDEVSDVDSLFEGSSGIEELLGTTPDADFNGFFNESESVPPVTETVSPNVGDASPSEEETFSRRESEVIPDLSSESPSTVAEEALFPNIDGLFQEHTDETSDFNLLESSSSLVEEVASDIDAFFQEQNESHLPLSLENPFAEAIAEQPILITDEPAEESVSSESFSPAGMFPSETVVEEVVQGIDIEIQFEPEGTIDLNNLEGLFNDAPAEDAGLEVENLFPENIEGFHLSLEDAFTGPNGKPEDENKFDRE